MVFGGVAWKQISESNKKYRRLNGTLFFFILFSEKHFLDLTVSGEKGQSFDANRPQIRNLAN